MTDCLAELLLKLHQSTVYSQTPQPVSEVSQRCFWLTNVWPSAWAKSDSLHPCTSVAEPLIERVTEASFFSASLQTLVFGSWMHDRSLAESMNTFVPCLSLHALVVKLLTERLTELQPKYSSLLTLQTNLQLIMFELVDWTFSWLGVFINLIPLMMYELQWLFL